MGEEVKQINDGLHYGRWEMTNLPDSFYRAEQEYLYPADVVTRCQMCDCEIDIEDCEDEEGRYCDECYELFQEEQKEDNDDEVEKENE